MPLEHPAGHAQVDFGEAIGIIGGKERKIHFFAMDLPHSDARFNVISRPRKNGRIDTISITTMIRPQPIIGTGLVVTVRTLVIMAVTKSTSSQAGAETRQRSARRP